MYYISKILTLSESTQIELIAKRVNRINAGEAKECDRIPGRLLADKDLRHWLSVE